MNLPTPDELQKSWNELRRIHREHLAVHQVFIPDVEHYAAKNVSVWLAVLFHFKDREVDKNEISQIVQRDIEGAAPDQQVRHLKRMGWNIGTKPGKHKLNPYRPSEEFQTSNARNRQSLSAESFNDLKRAFGYRCATCGASEGAPDPRYGGPDVKLQYGHRDPHKGGDDKENVIPQCQFCNRSYKNDFVFDERGRVRAVANVAAVKRANRTVQKQILEWLLDKFGSK